MSVTDTTKYLKMKIMVIMLALFLQLWAAAPRLRDKYVLTVQEDSNGDSITLTPRSVSFGDDISCNWIALDKNRNTGQLLVDDSQGQEQDLKSNILPLEKADCTLFFRPPENSNGVPFLEVTFELVNSAFGFDEVSDRGTLELNVEAVNDAPVVEDQTINMNEDSTQRIQLSATDVDGNNFEFRLTSWSLEQSSDPGILQFGGNTFTSPFSSRTSFSQDDEIVFTPPRHAKSSAGAAFCTVGFQARDSSGAVSNTGSISLVVRAVDSPPRVTDLSVSATQGIPTMIDFSTAILSDPDETDSIALRILEVPQEIELFTDEERTFSVVEGADLDSSIRQLFLIAQESGSVQIRFTAVDLSPAGLVAPVSAVVDVIVARNEPPVIESESFEVSLAGEPIEFDIDVRNDEQELVNTFVLRLPEASIGTVTYRDGRRVLPGSPLESLALVFESTLASDEDALMQVIAQDTSSFSTVSTIRFRSRSLVKLAAWNKAIPVSSDSIAFIPFGFRVDPSHEYQVSLSELIEDTELYLLREGFEGSVPSIDDLGPLLEETTLPLNIDSIAISIPSGAEKDIVLEFFVRDMTSGAERSATLTLLVSSQVTVPILSNITSNVNGSLFAQLDLTDASNSSFTYIIVSLPMYGELYSPPFGNEPIRQRNLPIDASTLFYKRSQQSIAMLDSFLFTAFDTSGHESTPATAFIDLLPPFEVTERTVYAYGTSPILFYVPVERHTDIDVLIASPPDHGRLFFPANGVCGDVADAIQGPIRSTTTSLCYKANTIPATQQSPIEDAVTFRIDTLEWTTPIRILRRNEPPVVRTKVLPVHAETVSTVSIEIEDSTSDLADVTVFTGGLLLFGDVYIMDADNRPQRLLRQRDQLQGPHFRLMIRPDSRASGTIGSLLVRAVDATMSSTLTLLSVEVHSTNAAPKMKQAELLMTTNASDSILFAVEDLVELQPGLRLLVKHTPADGRLRAHFEDSSVEEVLEDGTLLGESLVSLEFIPPSTATQPSASFLITVDDGSLISAIDTLITIVFDQSIVQGNEGMPEVSVGEAFVLNLLDLAHLNIESSDCTVQEDVSELFQYNPSIGTFVGQSLGQNGIVRDVQCRLVYVPSKPGQHLLQYRTAVEPSLVHQVELRAVQHVVPLVIQDVTAAIALSSSTLDVIAIINTLAHSTASFIKIHLLEEGYGQFTPLLTLNGSPISFPVTVDASDDLILGLETTPALLDCSSQKLFAISFAVTSENDVSNTATLTVFKRYDSRTCPTQVTLQPSVEAEIQLVAHGDPIRSMELGALPSSCSFQKELDVGTMILVEGSSISPDSIGRYTITAICSPPSVPTDTYLLPYTHEGNDLEMMLIVGPQHTQPIFLDMDIAVKPNEVSVIQLSASHSNGLPVTFEITSLPHVGSLYQFNAGSADLSGDRIESTRTQVLVQDKVVYVYEGSPKAPLTDSFHVDAITSDFESVSNTVNLTVSTLNIIAYGSDTAMIAEQGDLLPIELLAFLPENQNEFEADDFILTPNVGTLFNIDPDTGSKGSVASSVSGDPVYLVYEAPLDFAGDVRLRFDARANGIVSTASVVIKVLSQAAPTLTVPSTINGSENESASFTVEAETLNPDRHIALELLSLPIRGYLQLQGTRIDTTGLLVSTSLLRIGVTLQYIPETNEFGTEYASFDVHAFDGVSYSTTSTVTVHIEHTVAPVSPNMRVVGLQDELHLIEFEYDHKLLEGFDVILASLPPAGQLFQYRKDVRELDSAIETAGTIVENQNGTMNPHRLLYKAKNDAIFPSLDAFTYLIQDTAGLITPEDEAGTVHILTERVILPVEGVSFDTNAKAGVPLEVELQSTILDNSIQFRITALPQHGILFADSETSNPTALHETVGSSVFYVANQSNIEDSFAYICIRDGDIESITDATVSIATTAAPAPLQAVSLLLQTSESQGIIVPFELEEQDQGSIYEVVLLTIPPSDLGNVRYCVGLCTGSQQGSAITTDMLPLHLFNATLDDPSVSSSLVYFEPIAPYPLETLAEFEFEVGRGLESSNTAVVQVRVIDSNFPPVAESFLVNRKEDDPRSTIQLRFKDIDNQCVFPPEQDQQHSCANLTARITTLPSRGILMQENGSKIITSDPIAGFTLKFINDPFSFGIPYTSFEYVISDGLNESVPALITVNVDHVNHAPEAHDAQSFIKQGTGSSISNSFQLDWIEPDGDETDVFILSTPKHGHLFTVSNALQKQRRVEITNGSFLITPQFNESQTELIFVPDFNFESPPVDSFTYQVRERGTQELLPSLAANHSLFVIPVHRPPEPIPCTLIAEEDIILDTFQFCYRNISPSDPSQVFGIVLSLPNPAIGVLSSQGVPITSTPFQLVSQNDISFEPALDVFGNAIGSFVFKVYELFDGDQLLSTTNATMTISINQDNNAPVVHPVTVSVEEGKEKVLSILIEDDHFDTEELQSIQIGCTQMAGTSVLYQLTIDGDEEQRGDVIFRPNDLCDFEPEISFRQLSTDKTTLTASVLFQAPNEVRSESGTVVVFTVTATDHLGLEGSANITVILVPFNDPPEIVSDNSIPITMTDLDSILSILLLASDSDGPDCCQFEFSATPIKGSLTSEGSEIVPENKVRSTGETKESLPLSFSPLSTGGGNPYVNFTVRAFDGLVYSKPKTFLIATDCRRINTVPNVWSDGSICEPCPNGAICSEDGLVMPRNQFGFILSPLDVDFVYLTCSPVDACPEGDKFSSTTGGFVPSRRSSFLAFKETILAAHECGEGYIGVRCAECDIGFFAQNGQCQVCPEAGVVRTVMIAVVAVVALVLVAYISIKRVDLTAFRIFVNFLQLVSFFSSFELAWSPQMLQLLDAVKFVQIDIDLFSLECSVQGIDFYGKWLIVLIMPIVVYATLVFFYFAFVTLYECKRDYDESMRPFIRNLIVKMSVQLSLFTYLILVFQIVAFYSCSKEPDGTFSLNKQPSLQCYDSLWWSYFPYSIFFGVLYGAGTPVFYLIVLLYLRPVLKQRFHRDRYQSLLDDREYKKDAQYLPSPGFCCIESSQSIDDWNAKFAPICESYKAKYYYWEMAILLRKFLVGMAQIVTTSFPTTQATGVLGIMVIYSIAHYQKQSFNRPEYNSLEAVSIASSCIILATGLLLTGDTGFPPSVLSFFNYAVVFTLVITSSITVWVFVKAALIGLRNLRRRNKVTAEHVRSLSQASLNSLDIDNFARIE